MTEFVKANVLTEVRHNGKLYLAGEVIEDLTPVELEALVKVKAAAPADDNTKKTSDDDKGNAGNGGTPPLPATAQAGVKPVLTCESTSDRSEHINLYAEKTNAGQLAYLQALGDEDFKTQAQKLLSVSKSKSKAYIERRLKDVTASAGAAGVGTCERDEQGCIISEVTE